MKLDRRLRLSISPTAESFLAQYSIDGRACERQDEDVNPQGDYWSQASIHVGTCILIKAQKLAQRRGGNTFVATLRQDLTNEIRRGLGNGGGGMAVVSIAAKDNLPGIM